MTASRRSRSSASRARPRAFALVATLLLLGCEGGAAPSLLARPPVDDPQLAPRSSSENESMVSVRVFNADGELVGPVSMPAVVRTEEQWRNLLPPERYEVMRQAGTERAFCGTLLDNKLEGVYACASCGLPLFSSNSKFHSGTGWPSFFQPIAPENVIEKVDRSHGMVRTEINCARCDGHLGHVFEDGPKPTGLRFCLNSESLTFTGADDLKSLADPAVAAGEGTADGAAEASGGAAAASADASDGARAKAVFAGGCFWCVEAVFEELDGVIEAISGYAGGSADTANYEAVCTGRTGHAEAVEIIYDPGKISYEDLLRVHFATHDPTTLNRQGNDVGTQYRSAIFYSNETEQALARAFIDDLTEAGVYDRPIVTTLEPLVEFHPAESYHQDYVCRNPGQPYVRAIALPKVHKVREKMAGMLKETSPLDR